MKLEKLYIAFFLCIFSYGLRAQAPAKLPAIDERKISLSSLTDSLYLDSLTIVPGLIRLESQGKLIDTSFFHYDYNTRLLYLQADRLKIEDELLIYYRVLPFTFQQELAHKDLSIYDSAAFFKVNETVEYPNKDIRDELFETPSLYKNGSISRGISIGNRQNVFLNSALNLQMEGTLSEDLQIRASITDQNIPIQPEGNTQQLQDFDNVYLELYNDNISLMAGDVILQQSGNKYLGNARAGNIQNSSSQTPYFLRYRRNVQGGKITYKQTFSKSKSAETSVGFALSKGKFASLNLNIQEGIQGPYQILSPENTRTAGGTSQYADAYFIIANSEKVYLDGKLLERGYDKDYTINYNLSEIVFTSRVILTAYSRVYMDFEYSDRSYSRSILTASHRQTFDKVSVYASYYREKDNPNQTLGFTLNEDDKITLSEAGDDIYSAVIPAVDSAVNYQNQEQYQTNMNADIPGVGNLYQVFYNQIDTLINNETYSIYVYEGLEGDFKVDFTYVGEGEGDYVLSGSAVNSKIYHWVAPVNGMSSGNYAPVRLLAPPQNQHMIVLGAEASISNRDLIKIESAFSKLDKNSFSQLDKYDDQGEAVFFQYQSKNRKFAGSDYLWKASAGYEYRQKYFQEIDPYRSIEFERDWTFNALNYDTASKFDDHIVNAKLELEKDPLNQINYQWILRNQGKALNGMQHRAFISKSLGMFQVNADGFFMHSSRFDTQASWNRWSVEALHRGKYIRPGYKFSVDKNRQVNTEQDSIILSTMNYEEHLFYLRNSDSLNGIFQLEYSIRKDFLPLNNTFLQSDLAQTLTASADLPINDKHHLDIQLAYRQLDIVGDSVFSESNYASSLNDNNTLMGQLNWSGSMANGAIRTDLNYSLANGREPKREYVYILVPVGEGSYTWRDDNNNGIEELDEFYEARYFDERNYIRVFVPSNEYVLAYTNALNYQMNIQPPSAWLDQGGIKNIVGRFSNLTAWNITKKLDDENMSQKVIPWLKTENENLLSIRENFNSTLFFNRRQTTHGAEIGLRNQRRKQLLNNGFEERIKHSVLLAARMNLDRNWGLKGQLEKGREEQTLEIDAQSSRNFDISYYTIWPELSWQPGMNARISAKYTFTHKQNFNDTDLENGDQIAMQHIVGMDFRLTQLMKHNINASIEFINIDYDSELNSSLAYEMLDGLNKGANMRWTLNWQQQLLEGLQLVVNYYGRKSSEQNTIHSGTMIVRALF